MMGDAGVPNADLAAIIASYNSQVASSLEQFKAANEGVTATVVDTQAPFNLALDDPPTYGSPDAVCVNEDGVSCVSCPRPSPTPWGPSPSFFSLTACTAPPGKSSIWRTRRRPQTKKKTKHADRLSSSFSLHSYGMTATTLASKSSDWWDLRWPKPWEVSSNASTAPCAQLDRILDHRCPLCS